MQYDPFEFDHTIVITQTERVARQLREEHAMLCSLEGPAWHQTLSVLDVWTWLETCWDDLLPEQQLINRTQKLAIVKKIIDRSDRISHNMISSMQVARQVTQAISLTHLYHIPISGDEYLLNPEYSSFSQWAYEVNHHCKSRKLIVRESLPTEILKAQGFIEELMASGKCIVIIGNDYAPCCETLFQHLEQKGVKIHRRKLLEAQPEFINLLRPTNTGEEYAVAAKLVDAILSEHLNEPDYAPRIAICLKDKLRDGMEMHRALMDHASDPSDLNGVQPWDLSGVNTLFNNPFIGLAYDIISLDLSGNSLEHISRILLDRRVDITGNEYYMQAEVDLRMRQRLSRTVSIGSVIRQIQAVAGGNESHLESLFASILAYIQGSGSAKPSTWAEHFEAVLSMSKVMDSKAMSSADVQAKSAWHRALAVFATLDRQIGSVDRIRACAWLREVLVTTRFQPKLPYVAPVTVMDWSDVGGEHFDHMIVLGASESNLPGESQINPFLPRELQQVHLVPESTIDLCIEASEQWLSLVKASTFNTLYISCPEADQFGIPQSISPLIKGANQFEVSSRGVLDNRISILNNYPVDDQDIVPPVSLAEKESITGGTAIIRDFMASPHLAMLRHRLKLRPFPKVIEGVSAMDQGIALHGALEHFWMQVKDSASLHALSSVDVKTVIRDSVDSVFNTAVELSPDRIGQKVAVLERERNYSLVEEWIDAEMNRTDAFSVLSVEDVVVSDVYGLPMTMRIDRVDLVHSDQGNKVLIIDYKTGSGINAGKLNAASLEEPQLPIYAIFGTEVHSAVNEINGVCLAKVTPGAHTFHIRSDWCNSVVPKRVQSTDVSSSESWASQKLAWASAIEIAATGFLGGEAGHDYATTITSNLSDLKTLL